MFLKKHNSDRELIGQGLANIIVPFFGGTPAKIGLSNCFETTTDAIFSLTPEFEACLQPVAANSDSI
ncbi:hypothetical protein H6G32_23760 [Cylindrospermum sp. FACHB-282]|nr:SulP family inorganic anion transporter [Cylindrospermum sp. FACHB-282]MBD2388385.1 hypothetical protein [Cylindrospermum sp. FACHB-282]